MITSCWRQDYVLRCDNLPRGLPISSASCFKVKGRSWSVSGMFSFAHRQMTWLSMKDKALSMTSKCGGWILSINHAKKVTTARPGVQIDHGGVNSSRSLQPFLEFLPYSPTATISMFKSVHDTSS